MLIYDCQVLAIQTNKQLKLTWSVNFQALERLKLCISYRIRIAYQSSFFKTKESSHGQIQAFQYVSSFFESF